MPKISIAICTYNGEAYLQQQLDSFAVQTVLPDEIVVCDDCSADSTGEILKNFAEKSEFPVKLYFNEQNLGYVKNFEKAIGLCAGDIIVLSDQDDVWMPEKLEVIKEKFADSRVGYLFADAEIVDENLNPLGKTMWQFLDFDSTTQKKIADGEIFDYFISRGCFYGSSAAFRSKFRDLILPIPNNIAYAHDNWTAMMIAAVAKCEIVDKCLIKYRQHGQQASVGVGQTETDTISAAKNRNNDYDGTIRQLQIAEKRLLESSYDQTMIKKAVAKIEKAKRHWQNRQTLPRTFLPRLKIVSGELLRRHYHKHSRGFYSAVKDLMNTKRA